MNIKKITALAAALALALSLSACNSDGGTTAEADVTTTTVAKKEAAKDETTTAKPEETTEATTTEPVVEASPVEDFEYEEAGGEITITKYKGSEAEVIIPAEIDGKPVTTIGYEAFEYSSITSVVIPEGVKMIEAEAFYKCGKLADITLPESITNIYYGSLGSESAESPFTGSPWLENKRAENPLVIVNNIVVDGQTCSRDVEIPDGVRVIAGGAFNGCTTITSVKLPDSLETVGDYAFTKCERLAEIILPDSVSYIGHYAFSECKALENVTFPNNIVEMGSYIFGDMKNSDYGKVAPWLEKKVSENPLLIINGNLINAQKCTGDVVVPDDVKSIASYAFSYYYHNGLTTVKLPEGITKIPDGLFYGCTDLKSVNIPDSVTEIGWFAFCCAPLKSITIPNGVTQIDGYAFSGSAEGFWCKFESITIPGSVTEIGDGVFASCYELKSVTLSEGLKKIGSGVFSGTKITELTLPDSVESISTDAFKGCKFDITYKGEIYFPELYNELYAEINGQ